VEIVKALIAEACEPLSARINTLEKEVRELRAELTAAKEANERLRASS